MNSKQNITTMNPENIIITNIQSASLEQSAVLERLARARYNATSILAACPSAKKLNHASAILLATAVLESLHKAEAPEPSKLTTLSGASYKASTTWQRLRAFARRSPKNLQSTSRPAALESISGRTPAICHPELIARLEDAFGAFPKQ